MRKFFFGLLAAIALLPCMKAEAAGAQAEVTGVICNAIKDGSAPFDGDNSPGNDSGDNNRVLRTFDEAAYTLEYTMNMKQGAEATSLENVTIGFEFSIPGKEGQYRWATENMGWIASSKSEYKDGKIVCTGTTKLTQVNGANPVPGSAAMIARLVAASVGNGTKVEPTFKLWVEGDSHIASFVADSAHTTADGQKCALAVSATPKNLDLYTASVNACQWGYVNPSTNYIGMKPGKGAPTAMANTGFLLALRGDDALKGVKGMEVPSGDISFDLTVSGILNGKAVEPLLWDMTSNKDTDKQVSGDEMDDWGIRKYPGLMYGRETYWYSDSWDSRVLYPAPRSGVGNGEANNQTYNSGNMTMTKTGPGKYRVTVKDYVVNGHFPRFMRNYSSGTYQYNLDINIFSMGGYQFYIPLGTDANGTSAGFSFQVSNLSAKSISGAAMADKLDNNNSTSGSCGVSSSNVRSMAWLYHYTPDQGAGRSTHHTHDAYVAQRGQSVYTYLYMNRYKNSASDATYAYNYLFKFDDKTAEAYSNEEYGPVAGEGTNANMAYVSGYNAYAYPYQQKGAEYRMWGVLDPGKVKLLYACKKDGKGWTSIEEANRAKIPDLRYFNTLEEAEAFGTCIGVMYEGREAELSMRHYLGNGFYVKVREDAPVGSVGWVIPSVQTWGNDTGKAMTAANSYGPGGSAVPEPQYEWAAGNYTPTEYTSREEGWWYKVTEDGEFIYNERRGTGVSFLVTGEVVTGSIGNDDGKSWYNLNQSERTMDAVAVLGYSSITKSCGKTDITAKVTLGPHLKYVAGSGTIGGTYVPASGLAASTVKDGEKQEPAVTTDKLGHTVLTWTVRGHDPGTALPRIHYKLEIGTELDPRTDVNELDNPLSQIIQVRSTYGAESGGGSSYSIQENLANWGTPYCISRRDVRVNKALCTSLQLRTLQGTIDRNEDARWRIVFSNTSAVDSKPWNLYSALPYGEDGRGSAYHGTPKLAKVTMDGQYGTASLAAGVKLYVATDPKVWDGKFDAQAYDKAGISWTEVSPTVSGTTYTWNVGRGDVTGIKVSGGALKSFDALNFTVEMEPTEGSAGGDVYALSSSAYADRFANTLFVAPVGIQVVKRTVSGTVFNDRNKSGLLDLGAKADTLVSGMKVAILDKDGNPAKDVFGKAIPEVTTGADGAWSFTELPSGTFVPVVRKAGRDSKWELIKNGPDYASDASGALAGNLDKDNDAADVNGDFWIRAVKGWDGSAYVDTPISFLPAAEMNPAVQEVSGLKFGLGVYWADLTLEKVVDRKDSYPDLGGAQALFKAEGTGWDGKHHTYYFCVDVEGGGDAPHGVAPHSLQAPDYASSLDGRQTLRVPSGYYTVSELAKGGWTLLDYIAVNGTVDGDHCSMDLLVNEAGLVHARNYRTGFGGYRDAAAKVNGLQ